MGLDLLNPTQQQPMTLTQPLTTNTPTQMENFWRQYSSQHMQMTEETNNYGTNQIQYLTDRSGSANSTARPMQELSMNMPGLNYQENAVVLDQKISRNDKAGAHIQPVRSMDHQTKNQNDLSKKMEIYYRTNPLNAIPENWEQESKMSNYPCDTSISQKKLSDSRFIEGRLSPQNQMYSTGEQLTSYDSQPLDLKIPLSSHPQLKKEISTPCNADLKTPKNDEKRDRAEAIKGRLKQLFLNYCDYSLETGNVYITLTNMLKMLKDCKVYDEKVNQNWVSIIISKECNAATGGIKQISFDQFLNCVLRISGKKFPEKYRLHPKSALKALLKHHILPLIKGIEKAVESNSDEYKHSLYTVSELTLKLIVFNEDTQVIFSDILPIIKMIYQRYFESETSTSKSKAGDCMKDSLKSVMTFVRDFELCPYLIHQKACFLIWYSITEAKDKSELTNNPEIKQILAKNMGKQFTLGHFIVFLYRLGVIYFNHSQSDPQEFNLIKKLLFFLRKLENSDGFRKFMYKVNRTYNDSLTFLPSKDLLMQILRAEGHSVNESEDYLITKESMLSKILDIHLHQQPLHTKDDDHQLEQPDDIVELDQYLLNAEDDLKKLFEIYCSMGDPMNTKYLKSSKLLKMFKQVGMIKGLSRLPNRLKGLEQINSVDLDLAFKAVSRGDGLQKGVYDSNASQMSSYSTRDNNMTSNISAYLRHQSMMQSKIKQLSQQSQMQSQSRCFDKKTYLIDQGGSNLSRIDYSQFKQVLEFLAKKFYPKQSAQLAFKQILEQVLLPQLKQLNNKRCIHNDKLQRVLVQLDNQDMINLLTTLHKSIIDLYKFYADSKGYMNFQQFINFCTDYELFPLQVTKAALYRIFHSLSFMNDMLSSQQKSGMRSSHMSNRLASPSRGSQPNELIDEHLFVESLALVALYQENDTETEHNPEEMDEQEPFIQECNVNEDDVNEQSPIEKVIQLVERMANAEGLHRKLKKNQQDISNTIKCNLMEKKDLLQLFRQRYPWYFQQRYYESIQKKDSSFQAIMEMSSIYTEGSQLEL